MKKTVLASVAVAGLAVAGMSFAAAAPAPMMSGMTNPWSVGVGLNYTAQMTNHTKTNGTTSGKLKDRGLGGNVFVGYRINKYFGAQAGLDMLGSYKQTGSNGTVKSQDMWNLNFVGQAFLPVNNWFSPYVFGGMGYVNGETKNITNNTKTSTSDFGFVYGAGLQFNVKQFGIRTSLTREDVSSQNSIDYISLDVLYKFGA